MPRSQGTSRKGKPKKNERAAGMGRALAKAQHQRFKPKLNGSSRGAGMAMAPGTTSIGLEDDTDKKTLSVLELNDLNDFLKQADMANREFMSEKEQFLILDEAGTEVRRDTGSHQTWEEEDQTRPSNDFVFKELSVPRRPTWNDDTTPEELDQAENESFLEWRRAIALHEEQLVARSNARVTPFEKNLEVWRQLWRVLERCSCVLQIVDARNPLFYLSSDLRSYAVEELGRPMILVINKSDYLSPQQRTWWSQYFKEKGWDHLFFSAVNEQEKLDKAAAEERKQSTNIESNPFDVDEATKEDEEKKKEDDEIVSDVTEKTISSRDNIGIETPLSREMLLEWLHSFAVEHHCNPDPRFNDCIQFGMVGFPNVGKSSVINVLVGSAKNSHGIVRVAVAAQPGKTKHFQTLFLPDHDDMMLCDCPGLVFPSFVSSTADLTVSGVYPISQMRDYWPVIELICKRIPREILNAQYGIQIPISKDLSHIDVAHQRAEEFLTTYCVARSMLAASSGVPDNQKAARIIVRDYVVGKLLYCHAPPTIDVAGFQRETTKTALSQTQKLKNKMEAVLEMQQQLLRDDDEGSSDDDEFDSLEEDDPDILELMEEMDLDKKKPTGGKRGKSHKSIHKHGKKGRKDRNKDPYGCHSTPDEMLDPVKASTGLVVKAGKYGKKGYTRPTTFAGARAATSKT